LYAQYQVAQAQAKAVRARERERLRERKERRIEAASVASPISTITATRDWALPRLPRQATARRSGKTNPNHSVLRNRRQEALGSD
jgi:hypothetical protein